MFIAASKYEANKNLEKIKKSIGRCIETRRFSCISSFKRERERENNNKNYTVSMVCTVKKKKKTQQHAYISSEFKNGGHI